MDDKMPLVERLIDHAKKSPVSFHVPGHKGNVEFLGTGVSLFGEVLRYDLTELPGLDNLHSPTGAIRDAQRLAARAYGADYTYFLVNGSTVGLLASMLSAARPGDTVMVDRGCHSSVFSALVLGRLKPVYLPRPVDPATGIPLAISPEEVERCLKKARRVKAVVITSPTYYGICSDVKAIAGMAHEKGALLIVDEAHGAHFKFCDGLPESALDGGADLVVQSAHKTLPAMTQGSWLHVKGSGVDRERLEWMLGMLQTTSPSYIIMASLDSARYMMEREGARRLGEVLGYAARARLEINGMGKGFFCPDGQYFKAKGCHDFDGTKLVINCSGAGLTGQRLDLFLRNQCGVYGELYDFANWLGVTTAASRREDFARLVQGLSGVKPEPVDGDLLPRFESLMLDAAADPWEVAGRRCSRVVLDRAEGRTACGGVIPYPPGIPLVCPGERFSARAIECIKEYSAFGITVKGLKDGQVEVVE